MGDLNGWLGLIGAVIAIATLWLHFWDRQRAEKHDECAYLARQIADLQRANELCEMRCEELREEMIELLARSAVGGKLRRKRVAQS